MVRKILVSCSTLFLLIACSSAEEQTMHSLSNEPSSQAGNGEQAEASSANILDVDTSLSDAVAIFREVHPTAKVQSIDLNTSYENYVYEVTGLDANTEYRVFIDATSKEVLKEKKESQDNDDTIDFAAIIQPEKAMEVASKVEETRGLMPESWTLEAEDGIHSYTLTYENGNSEIEVKVDAVKAKPLN
ncbi:PepSY domain-containing protein [Lysinibacillus yapensis]|nr:PepSY domain-containing protein [Lysinibacillus yapensis]